MATIYERVQFYCGLSSSSPLTLSQKADLGKIILKDFYLSGYDKNQTALYRSQEPEGYFTVINYPDSFTEKIDQLIVDFYQKKDSPPDPPQKETTLPQSENKVTEKVTEHKRKRVRFQAKPVKKYSSKPENPTS